MEAQTPRAGASRIPNPAPGPWQMGQPWKLAHEVSIGSVEGEGPEVFGSIGDVEVDADGRIYILDRQANELRVFDAAGKHIRTTGRPGNGPGEFRLATGLEWLPGTDSLLVMDGAGHRYTILDRDGNFVRSMERPLTSHGSMFKGGFAGGLLYEEGAKLGAGPDRPLRLIGMRLGPQAVLMDTVTLPTRALPAIPAFQVQDSRGGLMMSVPFAPTQVWHLSPDTTLWWGYGSESRILQLTLRGDTLRQVVLTRERPVPVSARDLQEYDRSVWAKRFRARGGVIDFDRIPKEKPYFTELFVGPDGFLWVEVSTADGLSAFDIFDREGRLLGRLTTGVQRWAYVKPLVRGGRLYLVGADELNVHSVHVFRVEQPVGSDSF